MAYLDRTKAYPVTKNRSTLMKFADLTPRSRVAYTDLAKVNPNTKNPGNLTQIADLAIAFGQGAFRAVEGRLHVLRPWEDAFDDIPAVKTHIEQARANLDPAKQAVSKAKHQHKSRLMILKHADPWLTGCPLAGLNQRYLKKR